MVKNPTATAGDTGEAGLIPGSGRFPGGENGNPPQYSSRDNSMDREAWQTTSTRSQRVRHDGATEHVCINQEERPQGEPGLLTP